MAITKKTCKQRVLAHINSEGLSVNKERLDDAERVMQKKLEAAKEEGLSNAQFAAALQEHFDKETKIENKLRKQDKILQLAKRQEMVNLSEQKTGKSVATNFENVAHGGDTGHMFGGRNDPGTMGKMHTQNIMTALNLATEKFKSLFRSGTLDLNVFKEISNIRNKLPHSTGDEAAIHIAKAIVGVQDLIYDMSKAYSPRLEKINDYIIKRFHDRDKVFAAGMDNWVRKSMAVFGEKSFPNNTNEEKVQIFRDIWQRISDGKYGSIQDNADFDKSMEVGGHNQNIRGRMSKNRSFVSSNPEAEYAYFKEFGEGNLYETMQKVIKRAGSDIAQLEKFGTNPEATLEATRVALKNRALQRAKIATSEGDSISAAKHLKDASELDSKARHLQNIFREVTNQNSTPARGQWSNFMRALLPWTEDSILEHAPRVVQDTLSAQWMALGGHTFLRLPADIVHAASALRDINGRSLVGNAADLTAIIAHSMVSKEFRAKIMGDLGMVMSATTRDVVSNFGADIRKVGAMSKLTEAYGALGMVKQVHDSLRAATGLLLSKQLAEISNLSHDQLPDNFKRGMGSYSIGEHEWNTGRKALVDWGSAANKELPNGTKFINQDSIMALPNEVIENYMLKTGQITGKVTDAVLDRGRVQLSQKFGMMINDNANHGSVIPGSKTKAFMHQGTSINDPTGMLLRLMGQFKGAAFSMVENYRRSYNAGGGGMSGLTAAGQVAAFTTFMSALSIIGKNAFLGESTDLDHHLLADAFMQSGTGGIMFDSLSSAAHANNATDFGKNMLSYGAGPVLGSASKAVGIGFGYAHAGMSHAFGEGTIKAPNLDAEKWVQSNLPGHNLLLIEGLLNYHLFNAIKGEAYVRSLEKHNNDEGRHNFAFKQGGTGFWGTE